MIELIINKSIMKKIFIILSLQFFSGLIFSQTKPSKVTFEINYGLNANFFVKSYEEENNGPANKTYFYKKNLIGTTVGAEMRFNLDPNSSLLLGFSNNVNKSAKNYFGNFNGVDVSIEDFHISHQNQFYQFGYDGVFSKKLNRFRFNIGIVYVQMQQQEITLENFDNFINIKERNLRNSRLNEGGVFGGLSYSFKIDTKLDLGIKLKGYYLASVSSFEAITLTPTLSYTISQKIKN